MAFQPDRPIKIELMIQAAQPALLEGLDVWLRLGLLSDSQVKRLCRERLVCPRPESIAAAVPALPRTDPETRLGEASLALQTSPMSPAVINPTEPESTAPAASRQRPNFVTSLVQSFMAEISVIWLLFLGVFMVVVSSGVLAASQWQHFPSTEQYGILFGYTLAFWGASAWTSRQQSLHLTARMLQITTLLIVPVNFWMIDGFKLWSSGSGRVVAAIAALVLTAITMILLKPTRTRSTGVRLTINSICLSWLHWGWGWAGFPLVATYLGTVGTALVLYQHSILPVAAGEEESREHGLPLGIVTVTFATLLLIARAVFVAHVPIHQLGLALGICGWLLCWLSRRNPARKLWTRAGAVLLLVGWFVAVTAVTPWQAMAVSGLGAWLLADRLLRLQQVQDLTALFLVGLQTCWLLWRTIPTELQQRLIAFCTNIAGTTFMPWALVGVGLFPYVLLTLLFASRLRRWQQSQLAVRAEFLSLTLGTILTLLSVANPHVRSLNLLLSALTLAVITRKRSNLGRRLIYLTHVVGLAAVASGINLFFPNLTPRAWASVLIVGMVAEWGFSVGSNWLLWRRSAWDLGLVMAALSYTLLFSGLNASASNSMWLATPVALSWLASRRHSRSQLAAWLSVAALGIVQPLTLSLATPRLLGLGIATVLMLLNTQRLQHLAAAILTVGFGLSFIGAVIWQVAGQITPDSGINLLAITTLALWLVRSWLKRNSTALTKIYAAATDAWAIAIGGFNLIGLTAYDLNIYITPLPVGWKFILAAAITTSAIGYRNWRQSTNLGFYSLAWGLEVLVAGAIALTGESLTRLALAEFALGLTAQLLGDLWTRRRNSDPPSSWHVIPLIYAGLELVFSHSTFTASTGLYTLGAALIGIGVGRRHSSFKPLTYLAVFGVSAAAYELLSYHLLQTKGEETGYGILLMAMLGIAIAVGVRLLSRWLVPYLRLTLRELEAIAHFHWVGSSGLLLLALLSSLSASGELLWMAIAAVLAVYALVQGRSDEIWTYAGIVEAAGAVGYLLHRTISDSILVGWSAVIACVFAYGMSVLPWGVWGWSAKPWRRSATVLPGVIVLITSWGIALQSLLIVAAFYAWQAMKTGAVRLSYISMLLTDWAILRLLNDRGVTEPLWYATVLGGSLLYVAQVDPYLRSQPEREKRHLLRSLATGLICFTALYQSEAKFLLGLLTIGLSIMVILAGLALRTRAFLYVGTATFIIKVLRQLWLFINDYSLLLWAIGIVLGLAFIWIAATFEARRSQVMALVQYWMTELEAWE